MFACLIGTWQMWVRSPLGANIGHRAIFHVGDGARRLDGVRADHIFHHGVWIFCRRDSAGPRSARQVMGVGSILDRIAGVVLALIPIGLGQASVLYTFYPPLTASVWFYIGLVLVVAASWIWCALMLVAMTAWKRENPGRPVPWRCSRR